MYPSNLKYVESHQWIKVEEGIGTIGITQYGQEKMGDIVYVELPQKGKKVKKVKLWPPWNRLKQLLMSPHLSVER